MPAKDLERKLRGKRKNTKPMKHNRQMVNHRWLNKPGNRDKVKKKLCECMALGCTMREAAYTAGISTSQLRKWMRVDKKFGKAFDNAIEDGTDLLEAEAQRRAMDGYKEPVIYKGRPQFIGFDKNGVACDPDDKKCVRKEMFCVVKYSDGLMQLLLKGRRPKKFRENMDITSDDKPIKLMPIKLDGDKDISDPALAPEPDDPDDDDDEEDDK